MFHNMIPLFDFYWTHIFSQLSNVIKIIFLDTAFTLNTAIYTSCYFKVVTLFVRNLFRVRLPYLLLIRSSC
jgi:hypothetical protein